jgi:hypothetical protein
MTFWSRATHGYTVGPGRTENGVAIGRHTGISYDVLRVRIPVLEGIGSEDLAIHMRDDYLLISDDVAGHRRRMFTMTSRAIALVVHRARSPAGKLDIRCRWKY